eukprot:TRINITY_DN38113_c0_g1_i1.p1 TRINITY_DN38113_c0_g1~~TRINITY_DN38113_c0_g1_i1.p1  ORF type:complete len:405 (+),score=115.08 TRINITY_DN38113_c0_g1_i1:94-1308(+)
MELGESSFEVGTKLIGDGSYAKVYKGTRKSDGAAVAVKVMEMSVFMKSSFVNVALEIEIMKSLNHPNIVNMQAHWEREGETFLVLDYCGGGELFKYMKKYDISHMPQVAPQFVGEIVLALEYLREQEVLHRDLKPENILLTEDFHVKVADFGTACWANRDDEDSRKFTGTDKYMAPEMLQDADGTARAGFESDLWALGCIIFQLFCGRPPFNGATSYLVFQSILKTTLDYPPFVPEEAKDLIRKLLDRDQKKRIGSESMGGFKKMKIHPFFNGVDWDNINSKNTETPIHKNHSSEWSKFLLQDEEVIFASAVIKTRHFVSRKQRYLILTSYPRLFYVESTDSHGIKDHVDWTDDLSATAQTQKEFKVITKSRTYHFEDLSNLAHFWVSKINEMHAKKLKMKKRM